MAEFLSQEEIDEFLDLMEENENSKKKNNQNNKEINKLYSIYDFKKPNRISVEEINVINYIHNKLLKKLINETSILLNKNVDIRLYTTEEMTYGEFLSTIPQITTIEEVKFNDKKLIIEINPTISNKIIGSLLSSQQFSKFDEYQLKNLEFKTYKLFSEKLVNNLSNIWNDIKNTNIKSNGFFSSPNYLQIIDNNEICIIVVYELTIDNESGFISICYPISYIKEYLEVVVEKVFTTFNKPIFDIKLSQENYELFSLRLKNKDVTLLNKITITDDINKLFKTHSLPKLIKYSNIINDIKISTHLDSFRCNENFNSKNIKESCIPLNQLYNEPLEILINDKLLGFGETIILNKKIDVKVKSLLKNHKEIIQNINNVFNIVKYKKNLFIAQDNRALFLLEKIDDSNQYIFKEIKDELC